MTTPERVVADLKGRVEFLKTCSVAHFHDQESAKEFRDWLAEHNYQILRANKLCLAYAAPEAQIRKDL